MKAPALRLLAACCLLMSSACSTPSTRPLPPPDLSPQPPALCMTLCPPMPPQVRRGEISRDDLSVLRKWGAECRSRQSECIGFLTTTKD